ncbi:unnamed protein product, partial [Mesorhabditis belari]|uniref:Uncharacterized protein n=1 Tax=Mesorhabditis belari TaxID=2138241 RepID=A0AAF3EB46_9BILA
MGSGFQASHGKFPNQQAPTSAQYQQQINQQRAFQQQQQAIQQMAAYGNQMGMAQMGQNVSQQQHQQQQQYYNANQDFSDLWR